MTLEYSVVIFQACGLDDLNSLNGLSGLNDLDSLISSKKVLSFMFPSTTAPKWPILVSQCGMDHQNPTVLLIFGTFSLWGCGGHPIRPKLNSKDKHQISTPNEYTVNFKSNLTCIFPSVRAKLKKTLCPRTQCSVCRHDWYENTWVLVTLTSYK